MLISLSPYLAFLGNDISHSCRKSLEIAFRIFNDLPLNICEIVITMFDRECQSTVEGIEDFGFSCSLVLIFLPN